MCMAESPIDVLNRWEDHGAQWSVRSLGEERAVVELRECTGQLVEVLESGDAELLEFLRSRSGQSDPGGRI